jgi:hypothetical protein
MCPIFTFQMRVYAMAHFRFNDHLTVTWPDAKAILLSEYTGGEDGRTYPVTIFGEIRGEYPSIEEAEARLANSIGNTLPILSLAANAGIADPLPVAIYGIDLAEPQPFLGYSTPRATEWFPPGGRRIDVDATYALMAAVGQHPQTDLLHRAIESYRRAVGHWVPEQHVMAGEFLFIAAETLSRFLIETRAAQRSMTSKNLARLLGAGSEKQVRADILRNEIFDGDNEALEAVQQASNGFEHGFMSVDEVRGLLDSVLERSMRHVRRALITASGVSASAREKLLGEDYAQPRGLVPVSRFVTGQLTRRDASKPPPDMGSAAIELDWPPIPVTARRTSEGKVEFAVPTNVTVARLPENTQLEVQSVGMRAEGVTTTDDPAQVVVSHPLANSAENESPPRDR